MDQCNLISIAFDRKTLWGDMECRNHNWGQYLATRCQKPRPELQLVIRIYDKVRTRSLGAKVL